MACEVINSWTFIGLVGAFLDLFIAYILLCGSTVVYVASKVLGFFGLTLPCPCNGLFGNPNKNNCIQAMLVNYPSLKISNIQSSSMKKVPFDSISNRNSFYDEDEQDEDSLTNFERWEDNGNVEMGGEGCSSSWIEEKEIFGDKNGNFGSIPNGSRIGFRRRRKRAASDFGGKGLSFLYDPLACLPSSASVGCKLGTPNSITSVNSEDGKETLKEIGLLKQDSQGFETDDDPYDVVKKELALAKSECTGDKTALRALEQALDEEHAGRTALYHELEKERIAASTAADEAMAMIWRLQEEKAAIEMEAKQYQRMIEEKTAFDSEEMNILKEILLRRETEKLFLEKEVEAYKQMFFEKEQSDTDMYDMAAAQEQRSLNEEPVLMLQQIPQSVGEKHEITSIESPNHSLDFEKKGMKHQEGFFQSNESTTPRESDSCKKAFNPMVGIEKCGEKMEKHAEGLHGSDSGINHNVLDVHVIKEASENKKDNKPITLTSNSPKTCDNPTTGELETDPGKKRNGLERSGGLPPIGPSRVKSSPFLSRRNSMSAFDYERFKIENEVGLLRERLRILQQGREKLNIPAGSKEREQLQLQIMENIASQLREIRQLSEPGKALQQSSLPPPSSKATSKKRYRRGAHLGGMRSV